MLNLSNPHQLMLSLHSSFMSQPTSAPIEDGVIDVLKT